jgi:hypothetical protein
MDSNNFMNTSTHPSNTLGSSRNTDTAGPHNSNVANKLDPRVDSDRDGRAGGLGATNTTHAGGFGSQHEPGATYGTSTNFGPHDSNIANKLDPRIDSDRDGRAAHGTTTGGVFGSSTHGSTNAGPHGSNIANKLDPRVDSDRDNRGAHHGTSENYGPHSTNIANKLDPTVDSDRDNRGAHHGTSENYGPHSNIANKLDPTVDSDRDHRGTHTLGRIPMVDNQGHSTASHAATTPTSKSNLPGPAPNTAGPHKHDILNKLDPRVDSNMDGSKTIGGDKTGPV